VVHDASAVELLASSDSYVADAVFSTFVFALSASALGIVWFFGRHGGTTTLGFILVALMILSFPASIVRLLIDIIANSPPRLLVAIVWGQFFVAFSILTLMLVAPHMLYRIRSRQR
jgi:hypothetical protein